MVRDPKAVEVVIVGTGRVGSSLARTFHRLDIPVALISRTPRRRERRGPPVFRVEDPGCPRQAPILFLAVPDAVIPEAARVMRDAGVIGKRSRVGHLSGALLSTVLCPTVSRERVFSAHPLLSFPRPRDDPRGDVSLTAFALEAPDQRTLKVISRLFRRISCNVWILQPEKKPLYHAGAVIGSSFLYLNYLAALQILKHCGLSDAQFFATRLALSALNNAKNEDDWAGLTGPFARGDIETIAMNLRALTAFSSEIAEMYRIQGRWIACILVRKGLLKEETCQEILKVLQT